MFCNNTLTASLKLVFPAALLVLLTGCATMNEEECQNADWAMIGYEDGSRGYPGNRIGKHREACAKHGVTPDLDAYGSGRKRGLVEFCQPGNGYRAGSHGYHYQGVCPASLETAFLAAYQDGRKLYHLKGTLSGKKRTLKKKEKELKEIDDGLSEKEAQLIGKSGSTTDRAQLLLDIKALNQSQGEISSEIETLKKEIAVLAARIVQFSNDHSY